MARLDREIDPIDYTITVEAGVIVADVRKAAREADRCFPRVSAVTWRSASTDASTCSRMVERGPEETAVAQLRENSTAISGATWWSSAARNATLSASTSAEAADG